MLSRQVIRHLFICLLILTTVNCKLLQSQSGTSSALTGTVTDATGGAVPRATVTATNLDTAASREVESNGNGRFLFSQVNPGTYVVTVRASGAEEAGCSRGS